MVDYSTATGSLSSATAIPLVAVIDVLTPSKALPVIKKQG